MALTKIPANMLSGVDLGDSVRVNLGTDNDLALFHTGGNGVIHNTTGELRIRANNLKLQDYTNEDLMIVATSDGSVDLYHNNQKKFETTSTGASVTGNLAVSGNLTVSGTTTELDTTNLNVTDKNITLNYHASSDTSSNADGAGLTIQDAVNGSTDATILWDASNDEFDFSHNISSPGLLNGAANSLTYVSGGNASNAGANILLYGQSHGSLANITMFRAGGTESMRIDSSGNVGIGCTPSAYTTEIQATSGGNALKLRGRSAAENAGWLVWTNNADSVQAGMYATSNNLIFANTSGFTERMRIDSSGKVGIGIQTPGNSHANANMLVVGSGSAGGMALYNGANAGGYYFARDNANNTDAYDGGMSYDGSRNLKFHTNAGSTRMTIDGTGTVYIGPNGSTADPRITRHANGYDYVNSGNNRWLKVGASSGHTNVAFQDGASGITVFETGGTEMMRIDTDYVVPKMNFHFANNNIYAVSTTGDEHSLSNGVMILKQQITVRAGSKIIVWYDSGQILNNNQGGNGSTNSNPQIAIYVDSNSSAPSRGSANMINNNTDHVMYPAGNIGNARAKMHGHGATGTISSGGTYYIYMYGGSYNNGQFTFNYQNSSGNTRGSSIIWAEVKA